jgi:hypothetical protein
MKIKKIGNKSYKNLRPKSYRNLGTKMTKIWELKLQKSGNNKKKLGTKVTKI